MENAPNAKKTICTSRSFGKSLSNLSDIEEALSTFVANSAKKLRSEHSKSSAIRVFLQTNPFKQQDKQYNNSISIRTPQPTNSTIDLSKYANFALRKIFKQGYNYKKVGVILSDFCSAKTEQLGLDFTPNTTKHKQIMAVMDHVQEKWGKEVIKLASQGTKQAFRMRQERKSARFTTNFNEILSFHI